MPQHHRRLCQEVNHLQTLITQSKHTQNKQVILDEAAASSLLEASLTSLTLLNKHTQEQHEDRIKQTLGHSPRGTYTDHPDQSIHHPNHHPQNEVYRFNLPLSSESPRTPYILGRLYTPNIHAQSMAYDNYSNIQHTNTPYTNTHTSYNINNTDTSVDIPTFYHRDPFLQGAIWLTRNISIIFDDLYIDYEDIARENRLEISRILEEIKAIIPSSSSFTSSSVYIIDELNMKVRFSYEGLGQRFRDCQQRIRSVIEVRVYVFIGYCYCYCICVCIVLFLYILDIYILYIWLKP